MVAPSARMAGCSANQCAARSTDCAMFMRRCLESKRAGPRGQAARRESDMATTIPKYGAPGVYDPPGYSQAIKVTGARTILFLAGQVPYAPDGAVNHIGDFMGQARQVFGAVKALVEHAGGSLQNVVKITTYVTDIRRRQDVRTVRDEV